MKYSIWIKEKLLSLIKEMDNYPVEQSCSILKISRSAYYNWSTGELSPRRAENERIADLVEDIHEKHPEMGYRRLKDELDRHHNTHVNDKRMLRICRSRRIRSTIKYSNHGCTRQGKNPYYLADNLLNREFKADRPNQKWLTDVTEFKYYVGIEVKKVYLTVPETPTKKYHTFDGWFAVTDDEGTMADEAYDFTLPVESDLTLKAGWTRNQVSIVFDSDGGTAVETQTVPQGSVVDEPDHPVKEGYEFVGWFQVITDEQTQQETPAETAFDFSMPITENTHLMAVWTQDTVQVTFDSNGGTAVPAQTVSWGLPAQTPEDPVREGYVFAGWFRVVTDEPDTAFDFNMPITENTLLRAAWTQDTVQVTFDSNGGTPVSPQTVPRGGTVAEPEIPTKDGYEFEGWFRVLTTGEEVTLSETAFDFDAPVTEDISLRAVWSRKYTVRFIPGNETATGEMPDETVDPDSDFLLPDCDYSVEGKTFAEWYVQIGNLITYGLPGDVLVIQDDTTVTAIWADNHTITYVPGDEDASGTMQPDVAAEGSDFILPEPGFSNEGKVFMYWQVTFGDGETLKRMPGDDFTVTDETVVTAVWGYTVTFDGGDGSTGTMEPIVVQAGTQFSLPSCDFEKEGTKFSEWSVQIGIAEVVRKAVDEKILVTGNTTLSAVWMDTAAVPVFSPSAGTYNDALNVTVTCATQGAEIRYTVDGSDPAAGGSLYTGAIAVAETTTVQAIAMKDGMMNSPVSEATYTIIPVFGQAAFTLPEDTTVLEESAFEGVTGMTSVDASRCRKIGRWAFKGSGITRIMLPADCDINDEAFADCGRVLVFAPAGGSTEQYCRNAANPCVFIEKNN